MQGGVCSERLKRERGGDGKQAQPASGVGDNSEQSAPVLFVPQKKVQVQVGRVLSFFSLSLPPAWRETPTQPSMMRQSGWTRVRPVRLSLATRTLHSAPPPPPPPAPSPSPPSDDLLDASAFQPDQSIDQFSAFAHVLIDHPFPVGPYPYLTTIVLSTLALRLAFTLPATIWAHRRETRMKEVALPELMVFKNECKEGLVDGCRREGYSHEAYSKLLTERVRPLSLSLPFSLSLALFARTKVDDVPFFPTLFSRLSAKKPTKRSSTNTRLLPFRRFSSP